MDRLHPLHFDEPPRQQILPGIRGMDVHRVPRIATAEWFGRDAKAAMALWRQPPPVKRRYHLDVVRRFHNFLSVHLNQH